MPNLTLRVLEAVDENELRWNDVLNRVPLAGTEKRSHAAIRLIVLERSGYVQVTRGIYELTANGLRLVYGEQEFAL